MEQGIKSFTEILKGLPVAFQMLMVAVIVIAIIYFVFQNLDGESSFLPHTFDLKVFKVQVMPSEGGRARSFDTGYHKLQYVKVLTLTQHALGATPVYTRCVERLKPAERKVPVYDEAVYYTLERFSEKKKLGPRANRSDGSIDPLQIIPWSSRFTDADLGANTVPGQVDFKLRDTDLTDTFLSICHYQNGLQGDEQTFTTRVYEKTNDARLIVDLSSIPCVVHTIVDDKPVGLIVRDATKAQQETDVVVLAPGVFTIVCNDAMPNDTLNLKFTFDRSRA